MSTRRPYIDWARGVAVLIMIEAHALDAWTRVSERSTTAFAWLNILGGFAAPLFLWLAGVSLGLAGQRGVARGRTRESVAAGLMRRGAEIFLLAFLFRLQAFIVSPGNPPVSLLRVDILNIMGPSLIAAAFLWRVAGADRVTAGVCAMVAAGLAMSTPLVRSAGWLSALPAPLQWYVSPNGNHSTFTLFPWAGFVFAGTAYGSLLSATDASAEGRFLRRVTLAGLLLGAVSYLLSFRPSIYPTSSFWTTSPTYFGLRVGILMIGLGLLSAWSPIVPALERAFGVLARFGRHSLFIYWIHVELVYGYATVFIHRRLPLWGTALALVAFCCAMYWAIALKDRVVRWWTAGRRTASAEQALGT